MMFDLNEAIAAWRCALGAGEACTAADLDELESHLREQADRLRAVGLSEEEAFAIACRRLGQPGPLCEEFAKADPAARWRCHLLWMLVGALAFTLGNGLLFMFEGVARTAAVLVKADHGTIVAVGLLTHLLLTAGVVIWGVKLYRRGLTGRWRHWSGFLQSGKGRLTLALLALFVPIATRMIGSYANMICAHLYSLRQYSEIVMYESVYMALYSLAVPVALAIAVARIYYRQASSAR